MKIHQQDGTLRITDLRELSAANAHAFRDEARAALPLEPKVIEVDLSETSFIDSYGLGALVSLHRMANEHDHNGGVTMRLLNPTPPVQQLFELTRMHHLFEIVRHHESPESRAPFAPQTPRVASV